MELSLTLLNKLLHNILDYLDSKELKEPAEIVEAIQLTPNACDYWHIQEESGRIILWKRKAWLQEVEHRRLMKEQSAVYNAALHERKEAFIKLQKAICHTLEIDPIMMNDPMVLRMAEKIIKKKTEASELLFGVKLTDLPDLPNKHTVYDDKGKKQYEL